MEPVSAFEVDAVAAAHGDVSEGGGEERLADPDGSHDQHVVGGVDEAERAQLVPELAAYGGIFVAGSLPWGIVIDGFRPDRYDYFGAAICLVGVVVIMFAPRPA